MKGWPTTNTWVASFIFKRSSTGTSFMGDESEGTETTNIRLRLNNSLGPKHRERERDHDDKKRKLLVPIFLKQSHVGIDLMSSTNQILVTPFSFPSRFLYPQVAGNIKTRISHVKPMDFLLLFGCLLKAMPYIAGNVPLFIYNHDGYNIICTFMMDITMMLYVFPSTISSCDVQ